MAKNVPEVVMSKVNLIGETTNINGDLSTDDDLRIDGIVNGNIKSNKRIIIGTTATINVIFQQIQLKLMACKETLKLQKF